MALDIAQTITDRIISELEKGAAPWVKPWRTLKQAPGAGMPYNPASGTQYRGVNHFWLGMQPWALPWFVTYKQAQALGGTSMVAREVLAPSKPDRCSAVTCGGRVDSTSTTA